MTKQKLADMSGVEAANVLVSYASVLSDAQDLLQDKSNWKEFCEKVLSELIYLHAETVKSVKKKK